MPRIAGNHWTTELFVRLTLALLAAAALFPGWVSAAQAAGQDSGPEVQSEEPRPQVCEGSLLYRSPFSGRYEIVPLTHTDVAIDVTGLAASATVTQQYVNSSAEPVEAVYVFPLPHDGAVYDLEIRIGDRLIRSTIREREEAKRVYEAAKSEGKRAALVEEERPNIFTMNVANLMPGDHVDVRLRYVESLHWENGKIRLLFPMVVGPRYIPGNVATGHAGTGWAVDTNAVPDASRVTPPVRNPANRSGHDISVSVDLDAGFEFGAVNSISHAITVRRLADGRRHVELASGATIPNKDFILEVQQAESVRNRRPRSFFLPSRDPAKAIFSFRLSLRPYSRPIVCRWRCFM